MQTSKRWWLLSLGAGAEFLAAAVVSGPDRESAIQRLNALKIIPEEIGPRVTECQVAEIPGEKGNPPAIVADRLMKGGEDESALALQLWLRGKRPRRSHHVS